MEADSSKAYSVLRERCRYLKSELRKKQILLDKQQQLFDELKERNRVLEHLPESTPFQLGVAFVVAAKDPRKLLLLPYRIGSIFFTAYERRRKQKAKQAGKAEIQNMLFSSKEPELKSSIIAKVSQLLQSNELCEEEYSEVLQYVLAQCRAEEIPELVDDLLELFPADSRPEILCALWTSFAKQRENLLVTFIEKCIEKNCPEVVFPPSEVRLSRQKWVDAGFIVFEPRVNTAATDNEKDLLKSKSEKRLSFYHFTNDVKSRMEEHLIENGLEDTHNVYLALDAIDDLRKIYLNKLLFTITHYLYPTEASFYGEKVLELAPEDTVFASKVVDHFRIQGMLRYPLKLQSRIANINGQKSGVQALSEMVELLEKDNLFDLPDKVYQGPQLPEQSAIDVLYFLHNSLPFNSGGYATRAHGILKSLLESGINIEAVTRLGFPTDRFNAETYFPLGSNQVNGVRYHRLLGDSNEKYKNLPLKTYILRYAQYIERFILAGNRPKLLHAASNFMNGIAVNHVASRLQLPTLYEIRGLWEITHVSRNPDWEGSDYFEMQKKLETQAARGAHKVVTITHALKAEMIQRGIREQHIEVIPNGVDTKRFKRPSRDQALLQKLGLEDNIILGYVGSLVDYEGLEYLIEATVLLRQREKLQVALIIVGDGDVRNDLEDLVQEFHASEYIKFTGRVPHHEVERYYSIVDIAPFPRKGLPVCEMVSPMKPFEAMCMQIPIVASNVAALEEIIQDGVNGRIHTKDDIESLVAVLRELILDPQQRSTLSTAGRSWVEENRDWHKLAGQFQALYLEICDEYYGSSSLVQVSL